MLAAIELCHQILDFLSILKHFSEPKSVKIWWFSSAKCRRTPIVNGDHFTLDYKDDEEIANKEGEGKRNLVHQTQHKLSWILSFVSCVWMEPFAFVYYQRSFHIRAFQPESFILSGEIYPLSFLTRSGVCRPSGKSSHSRGRRGERRHSCENFFSLEGSESPITCAAAADDDDNHNEQNWRQGK